MEKINTIFTKNSQITTHEAKKLIQSKKSVSMVLPLWVGIEDDAEWLFPIEPLMSITSSNAIIKRNIAKPKERGTIKEYWTENDFKINIQGCFIHPNTNTYPANHVQELKKYMEMKQPLKVKNELLALLNIQQIVVEVYSFPFTKGKNVQNFTIDAVCDDLFNLFISVK